MDMKLMKWMIGTAAFIMLISLFHARSPEGFMSPDTVVVGQFVVLKPEAGCDLIQGKCIAKNEENTARLTLFSAQAKPLTPFEFEVRPPVGIEASKVTAKFNMFAMDMGNNQYNLIKQADGSFTGKVILPMCHSGHLAWYVEVTANVMVGKMQTWTTTKVPITLVAGKKHNQINSHD